MKIEYIKGDLFKTDAQVIMHGCNNQGVMGSGVAAIVRRDYPEAYEGYVKWHQAGAMRLGAVQIVETKGVIILNAITQDFYGKTGARFVSYDAVASCMATADQYAKENGWEKIAMPKIGAGLGGGNWEVIAAIIESEMKHATPVVYEI